MKIHRKKWKVILANIFTALTGLATLALILSVSYQSLRSSCTGEPLSFNNLMFFGKTDSQKLHKAVQDALPVLKGL